MFLTAKGRSSWISESVLSKVVYLEVKLRDVGEMNVDLSVLSHAVPGPEVLGGEEGP